MTTKSCAPVNALPFSASIHMAISVVRAPVPFRDVPALNFKGAALAVPR